MIALLSLALAADPVTVVVASRELPPGIELAESDLALFALPPDLMPDTMLGTVVFGEIRPLLGRVTRERVLRGDVIREERLAVLGAPGGVTGLVPDGWTLAEVPLEEPTRLIQPGRTVDLLWRGDGTACALLQAVWVVGTTTSAGEPTTLPGGIAHGIVLGVTPAHKEAIEAARAAGIVTPALRNDVDQATAELPACAPRAGKRR